MPWKIKVLLFHPSSSGLRRGLEPIPVTIGWDVQYLFKKHTYKVQVFHGDYSAGISILVCTKKKENLNQCYCTCCFLIKKKYLITAESRVGSITLYLTLSQLKYLMKDYQKHTSETVYAGLSFLKCLNSGHLLFRSSNVPLSFSRLYLSPCELT